MAGRKVLIVHQNFPGQFPHLADALVARGDEVHALGAVQSRERAGVRLHRWTNPRSTTPGVFEAAMRAEADLIRAQAAASAALRMRDEGFQPDVIIGHPGWGETLHLGEVFPRAKIILLGEFYYNARSARFLDPEIGPPSLSDFIRFNAKNACQALAYSLADRIVCPTPFQASTLPEVFGSRISVFHEGVDLARARRRPEARLETPGGRTLSASDRVVTFINRKFEPLRGFHVFMRALPELMAALPDVQVVLIGADAAGTYSNELPAGQSWKSRLMAEVGPRLDPERLHFLGTVPHERMVDTLSISSAHVYYTYPFVLSWSLIEAMGCECLIVGSDTAPVRDALVHGESGLLSPFLDVQGLSQTLVEVLEHPDRYAPLRSAARRTALERFDRDGVGLPAWLGLIDEMIRS